uniref:C-type lectin domain-containing protein n=1 Tax=Panagrolaimus sp. JU765 TaxID=591449 RepID=A0AC34RKH2_9BILA
MTMAQAQAFCAMTTGGNLVSIHSLAENTFVAQLAAAIATGVATDITGQTWIGYMLTSAGPGGTTWQWTDGSAIFPAGQPYPIYTGPAPWANLTPGGTFMCAVIISNTNGATFASSTWNEVDCNIAQANFVCKAPTI